jgi:hypothetical protein
VPPVAFHITVTTVRIIWTEPVRYPLSEREPILVLKTCTSFAKSIIIAGTGPTGEIVAMLKWELTVDRHAACPNSTYDGIDAMV